MNPASQSGDDALPLSAARRVDEVCFRFEQAWQAGPRPRIEDYLADTPEPERPVLLRELVAVEVACRRRAGEDPRPEDYQARFTVPYGMFSTAAASGWLSP